MTLSTGITQMPVQRGAALGMQCPAATYHAAPASYLCRPVTLCQQSVSEATASWGASRTMSSHLCSLPAARRRPMAASIPCHAHASWGSPPGQCAPVCTRGATSSAPASHHMHFRNTHGCPMQQRPHCTARQLTTHATLTPQSHSHSHTHTRADSPHKYRPNPNRHTRVHASPSSLKPPLTASPRNTATSAISAPPSGPSVLSVHNVSFHPPGTPSPLLEGINMEVPPNSLGLIIGRSGSGKTTLLQVLAGLCDQTSGTIHVASSNTSSGGRIQILKTAQTPGSPTTNGTGANPAAPTRGAKFAARMAAENRPTRPPSPTPSNIIGSSGQQSAIQQTLGQAASMEERMSKVGLVFQFPERHFLGSDVFSELTFSWPRDRTYFLQQQMLKARVMQVLQAVRLADIDMGMAPWSLSGGQQRRLALAIQLIRQPSVLLLDEPFAGLDWQARQEVVELLHQLKKQCTLLVVSHDLSEVSPLVDVAWVMRPGGRMEQLESWPPPGGLEQMRSGPA